MADPFENIVILEEVIEEKEEKIVEENLKI